MTCWSDRLGRVPELPEVQALVDFLAERTVGLAVTSVELGSFSVLKTFDPPPQALAGAPVDAVSRHGKFIDLDCDGVHLIFHLARAGWLRWSDAVPNTVLRPGKSPIALRTRFSDSSGFDLTEAGTKKRLAAYLVRDPQDVPGIASLGPDPLADEFTREAFGDLLDGAPLADQGAAARPGLHRRRRQRLLRRDPPRREDVAVRDGRPASTTRPSTACMPRCATRSRRAVATASGKPAKELKDAKRAGMRVHGRTGETCPVCGDTVREVSFADSSLQYCATCQTGGKPLADRRMSRLLK